MENEKLMNQLRYLSIQMDDRRRMPPPHHNDEFAGERQMPPMRCEHRPFGDDMRPPMPPPHHNDEFAGERQMPPMRCEHRPFGDDMRPPMPPHHHNVESAGGGHMPPPEPGFRRFPGHRGGGRILKLLADGDGSTQVQLAEKMDIRPQSLSELLGKLEEEGMIERRSDSDDRRAQRVFLTDNGKTAAAGVKDRHESRTEEFLAPLTEEERKTLSALLDKLLNTERAKPE